VAVGVDDSLTPSPKKHTAVVFMFLFLTNIKTMLLSRKSLFAVVALFLLMAAVDVATKTPYSTKISSSVNYLIGTDNNIRGTNYNPDPRGTRGSCEIDGCGKSVGLPTEDCKWGDASYSKDKGDQQGQKPGCTFCYSSEKDSEDSYTAWYFSGVRRSSFWNDRYYTDQPTVLSGVCKFKLPIGAECTSWSFGGVQGADSFVGIDDVGPIIENNGSDEHCMTNNCVSDDPNYRYSKWNCKA